MEILQSVHIQEENDVLDIHLLYLAVSLICTRTCLMSVSFVSSLSHFVALTAALSLSFQFDTEYQFNSSVKTLLSRLPKQRYLKSICEELHHFKIMKKYGWVYLHILCHPALVRSLCCYCQNRLLLGLASYINSVNKTDMRAALRGCKKAQFLHS